MGGRIVVFCSLWDVGCGENRGEAERGIGALLGCWGVKVGWRVVSVG